MSSKGDLGLSFLDVLSCTLGGLIVIFAVFAAMEHIGADEGESAAGITPAADPATGGGVSTAPEIYRVRIKGVPRPVWQLTGLEGQSEKSGYRVLVTSARWVDDSRPEPVDWELLIILESSFGEREVLLDISPDKLNGSTAEVQLFTARVPEEALVPWKTENGSATLLLPQKLGGRLEKIIARLDAAPTPGGGG